MSQVVCLHADTIGYPTGGGHLWVYLNWALGLRSAGLDVIWLEPLPEAWSVHRVARHVADLRARLAPFGLDSCLALDARRTDLPTTIPCMSLDDAWDADLLLNMRYSAAPDTVAGFRRSALLDVDPGLLQVWMSTGAISVAPHDWYFTTGETVGTPAALFSDAGLRWHYTPPAVSLDAWPMTPPSEGAPYTAISHWQADEWMVDEEGPYPNDKRSGFLPLMDVASRVPARLELALCLGADEEPERRQLLARGWSVRDSAVVAATPEDYRAYIQSSRGEFGWVKPSCLRLQNAWVSDRTICYLASGKPAIVQHTGPSRILPDCGGLCRYRDVEEAVACFRDVADNYERHRQSARALATRLFDARTVAGRVAGQALQ